MSFRQIAIDSKRFPRFAFKVGHGAIAAINFMVSVLYTVYSESDPKALQFQIDKSVFCFFTDRSQFDCSSPILVFDLLERARPHLHSIQRVTEGNADEWLGDAYI